MDIIEIIAASLGIIYIVLEYRANVWMWLFGIAMSLLYAWVFGTQHMYANLALDIYNVIMSVWGVYMWRKNREAKSDEETILNCPRKILWLLGGLIVVLVPLLGWVLKLMGESESPILDGLTASLSVVGVWMLAKKYYQQWVCWIVADVLYVVLFIKGRMWPSTILYAVYVVIAIAGYIRWRKDAKREK